MGAGVSQKVMNGHYYRRLKKIQRELERAGVPSQYGRFQLFGKGEGRKAWAAFYNTLRASNGETCGLLHISINHGDFIPLESYGKNWDSDKGIARIKELFGTNAKEAI